MAIFKSQSTKRVVTTQGVRLNNQLFWHPEMADIIKEQVTIYYNRGYNPSVSVLLADTSSVRRSPVELMALIDPDEERVAAHMADQKRQQRKVTDRLAYIRQSTKRITREAYAEEIDEQRQRMATVTSLEAARAAKPSSRSRDKAAGRRKGCIRRRKRGAQHDRRERRKTAEKKRALSVTKREEAWKRRKRRNR